MLVDRDLPRDLQHTWQINPEDLQLVQTSDGKPLKLGQGAYGTVRCNAPIGCHAVPTHFCEKCSNRLQSSTNSSPMGRRKEGKVLYNLNVSAGVPAEPWPD